MATDLDAYWMPFTANRQFKKSPRLFTQAKGMYFTTDDGRQVLDGIAGLWCVNAGHGRTKITEAIQRQAAEMDFCPPFQMAHPKAFTLAAKVAEIAPAGLNRVFFRNADVDRLIGEAGAATNDGERRQFYTQAQQIIAQGVPYISLWYKTNVAIFQPDIHGVTLSPIADFTFLRNVSHQPGASRAGS